MRTEEEIQERIKFFQKQQEETNDSDLKIAYGMVIGNLKWILID